MTCTRGQLSCPVVLVQQIHTLVCDWVPHQIQPRNWTVSMVVFLTMPEHQWLSWKSTWEHWPGTVVDARLMCWHNFAYLTVYLLWTFCATLKFYSAETQLSWKFWSSRKGTNFSRICVWRSIFFLKISPPLMKIKVGRPAPQANSACCCLVHLIELDYTMADSCN